MKTLKVNVGKLGESIVCKWLKNKGFSIVERNYLKPWGEIDVIAKKGGKTHFIEVKAVSRESGKGIDPAENLHEAKAKRIERAINSYLMTHKELENRGWQVDGALVHLNVENKSVKVAIVENIL